MKLTKDDLSLDARVLITAWFWSSKHSVEIGGEGAQSVLSERGRRAIAELVQARLVKAEPFNRWGRMRYIGTDECMPMRLSIEEMERHGDWSPTMPNPALHPEQSP